MLRPCPIETVHLGDVGPICKYANYLSPMHFLAAGWVENPPTAAAVPDWQIGPFVSLAANLPRFGTFVAGGFDLLLWIYLVGYISLLNELIYLLRYIWIKIRICSISIDIPSCQSSWANPYLHSRVLGCNHINHVSSTPCLAVISCTIILAWAVFQNLCHPFILVCWEWGSHDESAHNSPVDQGVYADLDPPSNSNKLVISYTDCFRIF